MGNYMTDDSRKLRPEEVREARKDEMEHDILPGFYTMCFNKKIYSRKYHFGAKKDK